MKVKITSCSSKQGWYTDSIGEIFEVVERGKDYVVKEDHINPSGSWRHIQKDECEIVEN